MRLEATQLKQVYAQFPSLKVNADRRALEAAATKVLGVGPAKALLRALADKDTYLAARASALTPSVSSASGAFGAQLPQRAVVSGLSTGGLLSAVVLAKAGYRVDAYEQRDRYSRNIQFGSRQALIDELASIDPWLSERFLEISSPLVRGFVYTAGGERRVIERARPHAGDPTAIPRSGEEMLKDVAITIVECKVLEEVLFEYLQQQPNVTVHRNEKLELGAADAEGRYSVAGVGTPDLVVVAEGANSATRKLLGINSMATSPEERFIAGVVERPSGGRTSMRYDDTKRPDGSTERLLTMALGSAKAHETWVLAEVPKSFSADPAAGLDPASDEYRAAQQAIIEKEFRAEAALVMEHDVSDVAVRGPIEMPGSKPTLFSLQQRMSDHAIAGSNVVGLGDFVGNAHFSVGGGMATAAVSHVERLKSLVFELELGTDKLAAMKKYEQGAIADSIAWGRRGVPEMYPDLDEEKVSDAYVKAVTDWLAGKNKDPLAALEKLLTPVSEALPPIGRPAAA
jgi:2-polyprenyl-6-methoxyphenol hydroxylase-like FAD-dependent oxidoreductase